MKRILFSFAVLMISLPCIAQYKIDTPKCTIKWGDVKINDGGKIGVIFDYNNTLFNGLSYEDYCLMDADFAQDKTDAEKRFTIEFNSALHNRSAVKNRGIGFKPRAEEADYLIVVTPFEIDDHGNFQGKVVLINKEGQNLVTFDKIRCIGGRIGSFVNLMGDGYERLSKFIGTELSKRIAQKKL